MVEFSIKLSKNDYFVKSFDKCTNVIYFPVKIMYTSIKNSIKAQWTHKRYLK